MDNFDNYAKDIDACIDVALPNLLGYSPEEYTAKLIRESNGFNYSKDYTPQHVIDLVMAEIEFWESIND